MNPHDAIRRLQERLATIPNVQPEPVPSVEILAFNERGTAIAVRPCCYNDHYAQICFDTNRAIADVVAAAGYSVPHPHIAIRNVP